MYFNVKIQPPFRRDVKPGFYNDQSGHSDQSGHNDQGEADHEFLH